MCYATKIVIPSYYHMEPTEQAFVVVPAFIENNVIIAVLLCVSAVCQFMPVRLHKLWVMPATTVLAVLGMVPAWGFAESPTLK